MRHIPSGSAEKEMRLDLSSGGLQTLILEARQARKRLVAAQTTGPRNFNERQAALEPVRGPLLQEAELHSLALFVAVPHQKSIGQV